MASSDEKVYYRPSKDEIPEGAIRLSYSEVIKRQWDQIHNWEDQSEVWALSWGTGILGAGTTIFGTLLTKHYRKALFLQGFNVGVSLLPSAVIPAAFTMVANHSFLVNKLITGTLACPSCYNTRSVIFHFGIGCAYPLIFTPIICGTIAKRFNTYDMPSFLDPKGIYKLWYKITKPQFNKIGFGIIAQVLLAIYIADRQQRSFITVMRKGNLVHAK